MDWKAQRGEAQVKEWGFHTLFCGLPAKSLTIGLY